MLLAPPAVASRLRPIPTARNTQNRQYQPRRRTERIEVHFSWLQNLFLVIGNFQTRPSISHGARHRRQTDRVFHQQVLLVLLTIDQCRDPLSSKDNGCVWITLDHPAPFDRPCVLTVV